MNALSVNGRCLRRLLLVAGGATLYLVCSLAVAQGKGHWVSRSATIGDDGQMCTALFARLNRMQASKTPSCAVDAVETDPQFTEPPWQKLDPVSHQELLAKLLKYWQVGAGAYFKDQKDWKPEGFTERAKDFIERGGEIHVWRVRLIPYFDANTRVAPPGPQTVIRLTDKYGVAKSVDEFCPGKSSRNWVRSTFLVLPDLSGPDPQVDQGTGSFLATLWPMLKGGVPYLLNRDSVFHPGYGSCRFIFVEPQPVKPRSATGK